MGKVREYMRCPVCGKLSRGPAFGAAVEVGHRLELLECRSGGRARWHWTRRPLPTEHLSALVDVVRGVLGRLNPLGAAAERAERDRLRAEVVSLRAQVATLLGTTVRAWPSVAVRPVSAGSARLGLPITVRPATSRTL